MTEKKDVSIGLRNLRINDYIELKSSMIKAYPNWEGAYWKEHHIASLLDRFPDGYMRVRRCAQARAIENECYVSIAGCVGNLPRVNNMDIQYAQSAVFTPSDFAFPTNGVKTEATPNTEMTLIVDVDLDLLKELHNFGSVRILKDRRNDLYTLKLNS